MEVIRFLDDIPGVTALLSARADGSMKVLAGEHAMAATNMRRRDAFFAAEGIDPARVWAAEIVHGAAVATIAGTEPRLVRGADALVTRERGTYLSVTVADCIPVFFADPVSGVVGIAHAGWRGIAAGIVPATVEAALGAGATADALRVVIGPGIGACHFVVGDDVASAFAGYGGVVQRVAGQTTVNLASVVRAQLWAVGVAATAIMTDSRCTFCDAVQFFSYRRDHTDPIAAMVAVVGMR